MNVEAIILDNRLTQSDYGLPSYSTSGAAAVDLRACIPSEDGALCIHPNETVFIPVGFSMNINDPSVCAMILPRSGLGSKQGIVLANSTGLIDSDYQGQLQVALINRSDKKFYINPMERIAQMVFVPVIQVNFVEVKEFAASQRGEGGFGSTGTR